MNGYKHRRILVIIYQWLKKTPVNKDKHVFYRGWYLQLFSKLLLPLERISENNFPLLFLVSNLSRVHLRTTLI